MADTVGIKIGAHAGKAGHQQVNGPAVPQLLIVFLEGDIPVRSIHIGPVNGGGAQSGGILL